MDDFMFDDLNDPGFGSPLSPLGGGQGINPPGSIPPKKEPNRMDLLNNLYKSVFGRAPDSNAVMYYMGLREINEDQIRKQMVESAEHAKIIEDSKQLPQATKEMNDAKEQALVLRKQIEDKQKEVESLNTLLYEKNQELLDMKQKLALSQKQAHGTSGTPPVTQNTSPPKKGFLKKIFS